MESTSQNLVLRAITLRGVGPYLHGEQLDILPLTILCGENGSGKSTWFKAMNLLTRSSSEGVLPFAFAADGSDFSFHDHTNAYLKTFPEQDPDARACLTPKTARGD